jgi:hypothetical protein
LTSIYAPSSKPVLRPPVEPEQFTSIRYGEHLAELGAVPSIGTVGDSYDCEHDPRARWVSETMLVGCRRAAA